MNPSKDPQDSAVAGAAHSAVPARWGTLGWGTAVAACCLALVGWSVLQDGAGAADDPGRAREVIGHDATRMTGPGRPTVQSYDATH